jgi:hypothetical protein
MKLVYSREGGLFHQVLQTDVNTTELPSDLQNVAAAIWADPALYTPGAVNPNRRDGYQYRLELLKGRQKVILTFDDLSIPDEVQPLIHFLQQRTGKP